MNQPKPKTAISPTRSENYPEWYQQVIKAADLAENSAVRGCMVIKPWGYAIWENMQRILDRRFKETGHVNAYFPLFIPMSYLEKEAKHVEGFAKECAVVTHHRLEPSPDGGLRPAGKLEEPLIIRPTSETIIGETYARWVQSYRDLPILINQWANVVRWEMRTRLFLRTAEFLWQEGHTVHATAEDAQIETGKMLDVYAEFAEGALALPVIKGEKTPDERFPGAVNTYTIEAMMQDHKALQAGTSHFLGQNFSRAQEIKFSDQNGNIEHAWTTSWGVSTRLIGAIIMAHSDDDGLVLPPQIAPQQVVLMPIYRSDDEKAKVVEFCQGLAKELREKRFGRDELRVAIDDRDIRGGEKAWSYIKKGVPIRIEVGPRDLAQNAVFMARRDQAHNQKQSMPRSEFLAKVEGILGEIQTNLYQRAHTFRKERTRTIDSLTDFDAYFASKSDSEAEIGGGFALCHWADDPKVTEHLKKLKVTARCIPLEGPKESGKCIFTGKPSTQRVLFAKAY